MQRLYPPLLKAVQTGLNEVLRQGVPIDKFLLTIRRERKFGSRDRTFVAAQLYDIVRYHRLMESITAEKVTRKIPVQWQWVVINHLRKGEPVDTSELLTGELAALPEAWQVLLDQMVDPRLTASFPDWLWEHGLRDYGVAWPETAHSFNDESRVYLRVNTLKKDAAWVLEALKADGVAVAAVDDSDALFLLERDNSLKNHPLYKQGIFEFQDLASQRVAGMSGAAPGMTVVDACAGAGGKTLHLAALMENHGRLLTADKYPERMKQLEFRCRRAGVTIAQPSSPIALLDHKGKVDIVLLDVPCTATGTIQRKPELKWRLQPGDLDKLLTEQREILEHHALLVKPGGVLVYATCSFLKAEGEQQVVDFLGRHPEFSLELDRRFLPATDATDGFYIAKLRRRAEA